jgi:protein-disulfide isomerase
VLTELNIPAAIDRITDINEIGNYGVTSTPALIINGEVAAVGSVPSSARLKEIVEKHL